MVLAIFATIVNPRGILERSGVRRAAKESFLCSRREEIRRSFGLSGELTVFVDGYRMRSRKRWLTASTVAKSSNSTRNRGDVVFETVDSLEPAAMQLWVYAGLLQGNVDYVVENVPRNRGG